MNRFVLLLLLALAPSASFANVYKGEKDGRFAYQANPCANDSDISQKVAQPASPVVSPTSSADRLPTQERRCVGKELQINFRDMPLKTTLAVIADFSGYRLVVDPSVTGSAPINYGCTEWDAMLQDIALRNNLLVKIENGTIFVHKR